MLKIKYPAALIRAAQMAQAKNDVLYYICGIHLTPHGRVTGTNGHILFSGRLPKGYDASSLGHDVILKIDGTIPATADDVTFIFEDKLGGMCRTDNKKAFTFEVVDGKYPDIDRVVPKLPRKQHSAGFGVNASYMAKAEAIFGKDASIAVYPSGDRESVLVEPAYNMDDGDPMAGSLMVVMPVRTDQTFEALFTDDAVDQRVREKLGEPEAEAA